MCSTEKSYRGYLDELNLQFYHRNFGLILDYGGHHMICILSKAGEKLEYVIDCIIFMYIEYFITLVNIV